jgi:hypothetical protein
MAREWKVEYILPSGTPPLGALGGAALRIFLWAALPPQPGAPAQPTRALVPVRTGLADLAAWPVPGGPGRPAAAAAGWPRTQWHPTVCTDLEWAQPAYPRYRPPATGATTWCRALG